MSKKKMPKGTVREKTLKVGKKQHTRLLRIKVAEDKNNMDETIELLCDCYEKYHNKL